MKYTGELEKIVRKAALIIAVSWLLLVAFIVVSANADNTKIHPPSSKNMVYYPQDKVNMNLYFCIPYNQFIVPP